MLVSPLVDSLRMEGRFALRRLACSPGFVAAVVLSLAVGIGASVTMLGIVDALLFRPPAHVRDIDRVVDVRIRTFPDYVDLRDHTRALSGVATYSAADYTITDYTITDGASADAAAPVIPVHALLATASLFPTLGTHAALGRFFDEREDRPGAEHVVVLGYAYWQRHYFGETSAIGRTLRITGEPFTIIGVAPDGFNGPELAPIDLFLPATNTKFFGGAIRLTSRNYSWLKVVARLKPGVTEAQASAEALAIYKSGNGGDTVQVRDYMGRRIAQVQPLMRIRHELEPANTRVSLWLTGVATLVLLIACANVANLILARAVRDRQETAIRLAIGISRARLMLRPMIECVSLATLAGVAALVLAHWGGAAIRRFLLANVETVDAPLDGRTLLLAAAVTLATIVLCGLVPAFRSARPDLTRALKAGAREGGATSIRAQRTLLVGQLALVLVLLVGTGLLTASLRNARHVEFGVDIDHLVVADIDMGTAGYSPSRVEETIRAVVDRVGRIPGVRGAAMMNSGLVSDIHIDYSVPGRDSTPAVRKLQNTPPGFSAVTPSYFATVGLSVVGGRDFGDGDATGARRVVIVNEQFARVYWPGISPLGRCVKVGGAKEECSDVIGIVADRRFGPIDNAPVPETFVLLGSAAEPARLATMMPARTVVARVAGDPARTVDAVRRVLTTLATDVPSVRARPAIEIFDPQFRSWRLGATLFTAFCAIGLVLAIVGVHGTMAYAVAQRTHELGIRMALGATARDIAASVLGEAGRVTMLGVVLGVLGAALAARAMAALLFGITSLDPTVYLAACLTLIATAFAACAIPAYRAARVDPMIALRAE